MILAMVAMSSSFSFAGGWSTDKRLDKTTLKGGLIVLDVPEMRWMVAYLGISITLAPWHTFRWVLGSLPLSIHQIK